MYEILVSAGYTHEEACYFIEEHTGSTKLSPKEEMMDLLSKESFWYE